VRVRSRIRPDDATDDDGRFRLHRHGPCRRWTFSTDALDTSGNGYNATLTNGAAVTGGSLLLDGTNDYAIVADSDALTPTNGITISCWYKANALPDAGLIKVILSKEDAGNNRAFYLGFLEANQYIFLTSSNGTDIADSRYALTITTGVWHHVAASLSGTNLVIMHDGASQARTGGTSPYVAAPIFNNTASVRIGARRATAIEFFDGRIGKVDIYNYALTTNAIIAIYNGGSP